MKDFLGDVCWCSDWVHCAGGGHGKGGDREGDGKRGGRDKRGRRSDRRDLERERERDLDQDGANQFASRFQSIEEVLGQVGDPFAPLHLQLMLQVPHLLKVHQGPHAPVPRKSCSGSHAQFGPNPTAAELCRGMLWADLQHPRDVSMSLPGIAQPSRLS